MPEEPQHDPNVPDPKKPWCRKCMAHTRYSKKVVAGGRKGSPPVVYDYCDKCGESEWAPKYCSEKPWYVLCVFSAGFIIVGLLIAMYGRGDILILGYGFIFIGPILYIQVMKHEIKPKRETKKAWLAWARERGYTGD